MKRRVSILLVGLVYILAFLGLAAALGVFTGILRPGRLAGQAMAETRSGSDLEAQGIPTLRPIWPENGTPGARRATRTPTPSPPPAQVLQPPTAADTQPPEPTRQRPARPAAPLVMSPLATPRPPASLTPYVQPVSPLLQPQSPLPTPNTSQGNSGGVVPTVTAAPTNNQLIVTLTPLPSATPRLPVYQPAPATPTGDVTPEPTQVGLASIAGRLVLKGEAYGSPLTVTLQSQANQVVASATVTASGQFTFTGVPQSTAGYEVVFSQESNPTMSADDVATWAWLSPVKVTASQSLRLPDIEISPLGFTPTAPVFDQDFSLAELAADHIVFTWDAYPNAERYWLDLAQGDNMTAVWKSQFLQATTAEWDGVLANRQPAVAGAYWWAVGAQRRIDAYTLTVYTYMTKFNINP